MATQQIKDILGTEVPSPSFVLSPSVAAPLPSGVTVTRNGQDNVARTLDPYSGKFEQVAEDTPRVYGSDQSLLVEAAARTNQCTDSSDISQWDLTGGRNGVSVSSATSILKDKTAHKVTSGGAASDNAQQATAGTFSGSDEIYYIKVEKGTSDLIQLAVLNLASTNFLFSVKYEWSTGTLTVVSGSVADKRVRVQQSSGPNGGKQIHFLVRVAGGNAENVNGEGRRLQLYPDANGNGNDTYFHHAQIEEAPNASSPIVTGGSPVTRSGDDYKIFSGGQPPWWNPDEGTIFLQTSPLFYQVNNFHYFVYGNTNDPRWIGYDRSEQQYVSFDGNNGNRPGNYGGKIKPYGLDKVAVSATPSEVRVSTNGNSYTFSANGSHLTINSLHVGKNALLASIQKMLYYPRALPESTLNILTT